MKYLFLALTMVATSFAAPVYPPLPVGDFFTPGTGLPCRDLLIILKVQEGTYRKGPIHFTLTVDAGNFTIDSEASGKYSFIPDGEWRSHAQLSPTDAVKYSSLESRAFMLSADRLVVQDRYVRADDGVMGYSQVLLDFHSPLVHLRTVLWNQKDNVSTELEGVLGKVTPK